MLSQRHDALLYFTLLLYTQRAADQTTTSVCRAKNVFWQSHAYVRTTKKISSSLAVDVFHPSAKLGGENVAVFHSVVEPLLMLCSVKMANIQKVAKNASLQRTPLSHPLKICQKHE